MSQFSDRPIVQFVGDGIWTLHTELSYASDLMGQTITVPAGFQTDFASVPRFFWRLFPPTGNYCPAAVIHDWLYRMTDVDRKLCDDVFLEGMAVLGVNWITRYTIYRAVRIFGGVARQNRNVSPYDITRKAS